MEFVAKYDFLLHPGYAAINIWKGPKQYTARVIVDRDKRYTWKELRGRDLERLQLRAMAIINRYSHNPILTEQRGEPLPVKVKTEDEFTQEFAEGFIRSQPGLYFGIHVGPEHETGKPFILESQN